MALKVFSGNYSFSLSNLKRRFFRLLAKKWFTPFGFYEAPLRASPKIPHPLNPQDFRDFVLQKMMFQENFHRAVVADKVAARGWVTDRVGPDYLIPLYDICDKPEDLKIGEYPLPCVIKSNHASGQVRFIKTPEDYDGIIETAKEWLSKPYKPKLEWVYRDITPKLIVEKMLADEDGNPVSDVKIYAFFGEPEMIGYIQKRSDVFKVQYYDPDWRVLETQWENQAGFPLVEKPEELGKIKYLVKKLTGEFDFIRLDLYIHQGRVYFGELTSFPLASARSVHSRDQELFSNFNQKRAARIAGDREKFEELAKSALNQ